MKTKNFTQTWFFLVVFLAAGGLPVLAGSAPTAWEKATADKLIRFLPGPIQGLTQQFPWDPKDFNKPRLVDGFGGWLREEIPYDPDYAPVGVIQHWRIADPRLLDQVKKAEKDATASQATMMKGDEIPNKGEQEMERKLDEWQQKMDKAVEAGNMAEIQRLQKEYERIAAPALERNKKMVESRDRPRQLKESARELCVVIQANLMPKRAEIWRAKGKGKVQKTPMVPSATIKGYPVGRNQYDGNRAVSFSIYLGPADLKVTSDAGPHMRQEVKAIFIMAEVRTNPENQAADEALALKMLEKVDYASLSKLIAP